jgi:hypothetical protein
MSRRLEEGLLFGDPRRLARLRVEALLQGAFGYAARYSAAVWSISSATGITLVTPEVE